MKMKFVRPSLSQLSLNLLLRFLSCLVVGTLLELFEENAFSDFYNFFFNFSFIWDPMGAIISKRYSNKFAGESFKTSPEFCYQWFLQNHLFCIFLNFAN